LKKNKKGGIQAVSKLNVYEMEKSRGMRFLE
jgi:hypothetical protein